MTLTPQQQFLQVALQLQHSAVALAKTYTARQSALGLDQVMTVERLSSFEGIEASLATIDALEQLVAEHKAAIQQSLLAFTHQLTTAMTELNEDERKEAADGLMAAVQTQLAHQHRSLSARAEWIDAARTIFTLARRGREYEPDADGPVFADEADLAEAGRQGQRMDAASAVEHQLLAEAAARIRTRMERLQPR